jgi:hypothetical protein
MKKFVLPLFLIIFAALSGYTQSFLLSDNFGSLTNGAGIIQSGPSDTLQLITWLNLTNNTAGTLRVMMKKEEINMLPGTSSSICWAGYCYGPEMMVCAEPLVMLPGELVSGCFGHFGPHGSRGVSKIRWTFFNQSDAKDSLSITVQYSTYPLAENNLPVPPFDLSFAGPVPCDHQVMLKFSMPPGIPGRIELRNPSGKLILANHVGTASGTTSFNTSALPAGVYYCTLMVDGKPSVTRKVPVCHGLMLH